MRVSGTSRPGSGPDDEFGAAPGHYDNRAYYRRPYDDQAYDRREYYDGTYRSDRTNRSDRGADPAPARMAPWAVRAGRVVSGAVTGAVLILAVVVLGAQYLSGERGFPGPGSTSVSAHLFAAVVAVLAQIVADRRRGAVSLAACGVVIITASILLITQWWG